MAIVLTRKSGRTTSIAFWISGIEGLTTFPISSFNGNTLIRAEGFTFDNLATPPFNGERTKAVTAIAPPNSNGVSSDLPTTPLPASLTECTIPLPISTTVPGNVDGFTTDSIIAPNNPTGIVASVVRPPVNNLTGKPSCSCSVGVQVSIHLLVFTAILPMKVPISSIPRWIPFSISFKSYLYGSGIVLSPCNPRIMLYGTVPAFSACSNPV